MSSVVAVETATAQGGADEATQKMGQANKTHGMIHTPEYASWRAMLKRCYYPKAINYANYGGRGIAICERWHTFTHFLSDMGPRPSLNHSIERRDNDGNYEPGNCYWATAKEQANNRRAPQQRQRRGA